MAFGPQALLRLLLELEEEGVLPQHLGKALPAVGDGIPDPIISTLSQMNSSWADWLAPASESQASSSGSTLVSVIYGYIDEVLMTNPCQWGRGA